MARGEDNVADSINVGSSTSVDQGQTKTILADLIIKLGEVHSIASGLPLLRQAFAWKIYKSRRVRSSFLPENLFAEPAWDILLLLYGVEDSRERLGVSAVCSSAGAPPTTVLRWIDKLERAGMVVRDDHPRDRRVSLLRLSEDCRERLDRYFDAALATHLGPPSCSCAPITGGNAPEPVKRRAERMLSN